MPASFRVFWDAKLDTSPDEYEDAFWPDAASADAAVDHFAVADGATESSYSRHWAQLLVGAVGEHGITRPGRLIDHLDALRAEWSAAHPGTDQPWYVEQKVALGSFAALLGVRIVEGADGMRCRALAVGDCCLVVVRDAAFLRAWPVTRSTDFGLSPTLLSTADPAAAQRGYIKSTEMKVRRGDTLFAMTDAIAAWFLREVENDAAPWAILEGRLASDNDGFQRWSRDLRQSGGMRNDDVTVAIVTIE